MKERPILMSAPMVRATLADNTTHTRRLIKKRPRGDFWRASFDTTRGLIFKTEGLMPGSIWPHKHIKCPYGQIGDYLWVRESFYQAGFWEEDETGTRHAWRGSHTIWYAEEEGNKTV